MVVGKEEDPSRATRAGFELLELKAGENEIPEDIFPLAEFRTNHPKLVEWKERSLMPLARALLLKHRPRPEKEASPVKDQEQAKEASIHKQKIITGSGTCLDIDTI